MKILEFFYVAEFNSGIKKIGIQLGKMLMVGRFAGAHSKSVCLPINKRKNKNVFKIQAQWNRKAAHC